MVYDLNWIKIRNMENWIYMNPRLAKLLKVPHPRHEVQKLLSDPTKVINRILRAGVDHGVIIYDRTFTRYAIYQLTPLGKVLLEEYENAPNVE